MRIGIDASNLRAGGGVTHLAELLHHANPRNTQVIVWGASDTLARLPQDRAWLQLDAQPLLGGGLRERVSWQRRMLAQLARNAKCDLLFVPGGAYGGDFRPYVTMCRNMLPFQWRERIRYGLFSWMFVRLTLLHFLQRRAFRRADGVIFLNEFARERVGAGNARAAVIPHGVSDRFRLAPRPQRAIEECTESEPFRLLYTSIVDVYKHQWHVAAATIELREEGLPIRLELAGPSYPRAMKRLDKELQRDTRGTVRLSGNVAHDALPAVSHSADAFVFASSCENMPNILIEAMAAGLPIASSNRDPMPRFLQDGGTYFDPEDRHDVKRALRELVTNRQLRERIAQRSFALAAQYSWERCANETFAFLESVAQGEKN